MKNIVLIGFMGSGKSTIARRIGKILKKEIIDTDNYIEEKYGLKIKEIFEQYGEEYFRKLESELRDELALKSDLIISCGGGFANLKDIRKMGFVVYLNLSFEKIYSRLKNDTKRPLFDEKAKELYNKRIPLYERECDIRINSYKLKPKELVKILELFLCENLLNDVRKAFIMPNEKKEKFKIKKSKY